MERIMIFGYSRVPKGEEQNSRLELQAFKEAKVEKVLKKTASGDSRDRPTLHKMLSSCEWDTITVWKLDRPSRTFNGLFAIIEHINGAGGGFKRLTEQF